MEFIQRKIGRIKSFSIDEYMILFACASLFLPMQISALCIVAVLVYALVNKKLISSIKKQPGAIFLYGFCILEIIVSLYYSNMTGVINAVGMLIVALYIAYYRTVINPRLFEYILEIILTLSIVVAIYGLFEYSHYSMIDGHSIFDLYIPNSPRKRIHVTFMNANLYAMMIEFFVVFCLYRWVKVKSVKRKAYYVFISLLNLFVLYLTGCRAALGTLIIVFSIFFVVYGERKWDTVMLRIMVLAFGITFIAPDLIPRIDDLSTISSRFKIWSGAFEGIMMFPLFGNGPQTYGHLYKAFGWHKAPHAHNIYIDSISSYGIIGTTLLLSYAYFVLKEIYSIRKHRAKFALIISFIIILLVHGMVDCTLNVISTSMVFFMIINAGSMFTKKD